jgi:hypothetical protein
LISVYLYTRPPQTASQPAPGAAPAPGVVQANAGAPLALAQGAPTQAAQLQVAASPIPPSATAVPPSATAVVPTVTLVPPSATPAPPTATAVPPTATAVPGVKVPDIRGKSLKDAQETLTKAGLRLGETRERCDDIGASEAGGKLKKGQVRCQSPAPGTVAASNTLVQFVLVGGDKGNEDED